MSILGIDIKMTFSYEVWKDIPGYEGKYQASVLGRIRSVDHYTTVVPRNGKKPYTVMMRGRVLHPAAANAYGHLGVRLWRDGLGKTYLVHYLVMITFTSDRPANSEIRHLNGNRLDNTHGNLAFGTRADNQADMYRYGDLRANGKLTIEQVLEIRRRLSTGEKQTQIAQDFGVSSTVITNIKLGRAWYWLDSFLSTSKPMQQ